MKLDTWTGLEASDDCGEASDRVVVINVKDEWARKWFDTRDGRDWLRDNGFDSPPVYAPERECRKSDPRATLEINVSEGQVISQPVLPLQGTMDATGGFKSWILEFGLGSNPDGWTTLAEGKQPVNNAALFNWDLSNLSNQTITLHLYMNGENGFAEKTVHFALALPTPTPAPTSKLPCLPRHRLCLHHRLRRIHPRCPRPAKRQRPSPASVCHPSSARLLYISRGAHGYQPAGGTIFCCSIAGTGAPGQAGIRLGEFFVALPSSQ